MKKCRTYNTLPALAAVALICTAGTVWADELTTSGQPSGQYTNADDGATCGGTNITQNTDPNTLGTGTIACANTGGGPTVENAYARSYSIAAATTIKCVDFAVQTNVGGDWPVRVRLYSDTNGGAPNTANLVQLGPDVNVVIPGGAANTFHSAVFPAAVNVPAGTTLVVELFQACRTTVSSATCPPGGDGGRLFVGSNSLGESAPSYLKAPGCGLNDFATLASLGFPTVHIIQVLGTGGNPCLQPLPPCPSDIAGPNNGPPDGLTNVTDLLACINTWGQNGNPSGPRPLGDVAPLPNGDCFVNVQDMLGVINGWGPCPQPTGACCLTNGQCLTNQTSAQCTNQGGTYQGNGSACPGGGCPIVPANDNCVGATEVFNGATNINNTGATDSTGIPGGACIFGGATNIHKDVWYRYTATCTGTVTVDVCATTGTVTDTTLQVYSGTCGALVEAACDDDACTGNPAGDRSRATFSATSGTQYFIRVGVWGTNAPGPMVLTIGCALANNDFCNEATALAIPSSTNGTILGATADQAPACNNVQMSKGRWYTVIGNGQTLTASLCASPFQLWDSRLSVYCGPSCSTLFCIVAADDTCGAHSQVSWCSANGQKYYVVVHTPDVVSAPDGAYVLQVSSSGAACGNPLPCGLANDSCAGAIDVTANINGANVTGDNTSATPAAGNDPELPAGSPTCHWAGTPTAVHNTVWYKFTAPNPAVPGITVETCPSTTPFRDSSIAIYSGTCGSLVQVACGEDECTADAYYSSATVVNPTPGQVYLVMVGNAGGSLDSVVGPYVVKLSGFAPCNWTCPAGSAVEGEPCLVDGATDTTNGGCNSTPTVYSTNMVRNGPAVCGNGSTRINGATQTRDTDWYHITGNGQANRITVNAEFTALVGFVSGVGTIGGPCTTPAFVAGSTATTTGNCNEVTSPATVLTNGVNYAVFVGPSGFTGWPCSAGQNDYWAKLISP